MKTFTYRGVGVALATPFEANGEIDFVALERLVNYVTDNGVDYLVALGTTGETPTLSKGEKSEVLAAVKRFNRGRLPIIAGIGGNCTSAIIDDIRTTDLEGVSAILSVSPYYNKPNQRGLYEHYRTIAENAPLPVILYNVPSRTGVNMLPETTLRLARDVKNIAAIKEANGDTAQVDTLLKERPAGFHIISGEDATALHTVMGGGSGVISTAANVIPKLYTEMIGERSDEKWNAMAEFVKAIFEEGSPTGIKAGLHSLGIIENRLRLPLVGASEDLYRRIADMTATLTQ